MEIVTVNGQKVAVIRDALPVIQTPQDALDLLATLSYTEDCHHVALRKEALCADFFKLATGVAGEIAQKFVNYGAKLAVYGDFSAYTSRPLRDYMYECNNGRDLFFVDTEEAAIARVGALSERPTIA